LEHIEELVTTSLNLKAIREGLIETIPCEPSHAREELRKMAFSDLLAVYIGWVDRLIEPRPREVRVWDGFFTECTQAHADEINSLAGLFERGEDLKPYLSPRVDASGYAPYSKTRSGLIVGGKDRALNAYGAHHLHLFPANKNGKRTGQSKALLFVRVKRDHALFLMCGDHMSFDDGTLRQAVADFNVASGNYVRGISGVSREINAREGEALARNGINALTESQGLFAVPGLLSAALTSMNHRRHADSILDFIEEWEPLFRDDAGRLKICREFDFPHTKNVRFGWSLHYSTLYLVEENSSKALVHLPYQYR
jgi:hypothetical protein